MKLLVLGHGRHGKDTVSEILHKEFGYTFQSSSYFCASRFIFDALKNKYHYESVEECYQDRHSHRSEWYNLIRDFNKGDDARLGREIFSEFDIYCGLRDKSEFNAIVKENIVDAVIWVDRSEYLPVENSSSMTLSSENADYIIDNNGSLEELKQNVKNVLTVIKKVRGARMM